MAKGRKSRLPVVISILIIVVLVGSWFVFPAYQSFLGEAYAVLTSGDNQRVNEWISQFGYMGPLIIILAMVVQMFAVVINVVLLMVVAILAYGPFWGSVISLVGIFTASTVGYVIGRSLNEAFTHKLVGSKNASKVLEMIHRYGYKAIVIVRLAPFLSNDAVSFAAGLSRLNYLKFMTATFIGILPLTIVIAWLGEDWERLKTGLVWISIISLVAFVIYIIYQQKKKGSSNVTPVNLSTEKEKE